MKRAKKIARRNSRNKSRIRRKNKALVVASTFATAGTTLVTMALAVPAGADYASPNNFFYTPGLTLAAGGSVAVSTLPGSKPPVALFLDGNNSALSIGTEIGSGYSPDSGDPFSTATGTIPLFVDYSFFSDPVVTTDCAGESITNGSASGTYAGCFLKSFDASADLLDAVPVTVAFPIVTQSATASSGLSNGSSVTVKTNAQGDPTYAATDSVNLEECAPMPVGVGFDINQCTGLGTMTGTSGNYTATVPVQSSVGETLCAGHSGWNGQCSLWTVEVHNETSGKYWWPLANGIPINFK